MKKSIITCTIVLLLIVAGGFFYYYQYVEEVTDRYLLKYELPSEMEGIYGTIKSEPRFEFVKLNKYESDSVAVDLESKDAADFHKWILDKIAKEEFDESDIKNRAKLHAYESLLSEKRILISISHIRSMDSKEALEIIKKHGIFSKDIVEYAERNKLKARIYPLN